MSAPLSISAQIKDYKTRRFNDSINHDLNGKPKNKKADKKIYTAKQLVTRIKKELTGRTNPLKQSILDKINFEESR